MATLRFEPIAMQLAKVASPTLLFSSDTLERIRRGEVPGEADPAWTDEVRGFMGHYMAVVRAAHLLLGAAPFERLGRLQDELEQEYQPGGPPKSPVYDSLLVQHVLGGVPQGLARETPYTVLARLSSGDPARARLHALAVELASSHLDVYRVTRAPERSGRSGPSDAAADLVAVRTGEALTVHATGPFLRDGDLVLARVVTFGDARFIADSPYLLQASEKDWLAYFERVAQAHAEQQERPAASGSKATGKPKLTPKQAARRRKEQQLKAAQNTPSEAVVRHLRHGHSERSWLDYIVSAYAGERRGIARLAGVPDRPETLPHGLGFRSAGHEDAADAAPPLPMAQVRDALVGIAEREGLFERERRAFEALALELGASTPELNAGDIYLFTAYCTLAARTAQGLTALELFEQDPDLDPDVRAVVESIQRGGFAVLRLEHVHLDEGLEAFDVLSQRNVRISERSATRQVGIGELLLGWLCVTEDGVVTLEGGVQRVPALVAPSFCDVATRLRDERRERWPDESERERNAQLPPALLAHLAVVREHPPLPAFERAFTERVERASIPLGVGDIPPDALHAMHEQVQEHIRRRFDDRIPQFGGKTLRQLASLAPSRADAVNWLREQERILKRSPQMAELDMRPLWRELGLDYQGLDTDPG